MGKPIGGDSVKRKPIVELLILFAFMSFMASAASAQSAGSVSGRVLDQSTQRPLPGAAVKLDGTSLSTDTDRAGAFRLLRVPTGPQRISISYLGYEITAFDVEVRSGETVDLQATIKPLPQIKEYVEVHSDQLDGQARALNLQKTSPNIVNVVSSDQIGRFPDPNAAEATQRIPGIVIQRDQGEGRFVSVRGTEPRLNSVMINGERIPAPEGDIRYVALDVVPADLLEAWKAVTEQALQLVEACTGRCKAKGIRLHGDPRRGRQPHHSRRRRHPHRSAA